MEWVNIKYQFTPDLSVRLGRIVLPTFLYSDTRKVAYTYPWVRLAQEVYRQSPMTASDGVDVQYRMHTDDFTHTVQANYGSARQALPGAGGTIKAEQVVGHHLFSRISCHHCVPGVSTCQLDLGRLSAVF